jgi:20S proteasome alpha/beta subunit
MLCRDGVVIGADREVSYDTTKFHGPKAHIIQKRGLQIGMVGAGSEDLITWGAQELDRRLRDNQSAEDVRLAAEALAQDVYDRHVKAEPKHSLHMLIGIKTDVEIRLLKVAGTVVVWESGWEAVGYGHEVANYALRGLYRHADSVSPEQATILTAQALKAAKDHAKYCGGPSDVIVLKRGYHAWRLPEDDVLEHERGMTRFSDYQSSVGGDDRCHGSTAGAESNP